MSAVETPHEPPPTETGPAVPAVADDDGEPRRLGTPFLVMQFFLFPLGIVAVCVAVFVVFGLIANEGKSARDYLQEIRSGGTNRRWQAAFELSKVLQSGKDPALADPAFVPQAIEVFEASSNDDPRVRRYLALTLGRLRDKRAVPALARVARGEGGVTDPDTQMYAVLALGAIGDPSAAPELLPLAGSSDPGMRKAVAHALGSLPSEASRAALQQALRDEVPDVRWNAGLALARRGDAAAGPVLLAMMDRAHMQSVSGLSGEQREEAMLEAIRVAPVVPDPTLRPALERLRAGDPSPLVREAAARALDQPAR
jgi:HEAT repeat protein